MMEAGTVRDLEPGLVPMTPALAAALARASEAAMAAGGREVTLEHLLHALIDDADALAVLDSSRVNVDQLRYEISLYLGGLPPPNGDARRFGVSADATRILEAASAAARGGRRRDINGAIVLAAVVGDGQSVAAQLLQNQGLTFDEAIRALQRAAATVVREAPAPLPAADDVLARARERVQSRSQPSLRQMIEGVSRTPPPSVAPASEPYVPTPFEPDAQPLVAPSFGNAPEDLAAAAAPDDLEMETTAPDAGRDAAEAADTHFDERDREASAAGIAGALGDDPPQQWDYDASAPYAPGPPPAYQTPLSPPFPPPPQEFHPAPMLGAPEWPESPPYPPPGTFEPQYDAPMPRRDGPPPRVQTHSAQPPPIPHWGPLRPVKSGGDFGSPPSNRAPLPAPDGLWPHTDPFVLPSGVGMPRFAAGAEPGFGEPPPPPQLAAAPGLTLPAPRAPAPAARRGSSTPGEVGQLAENIPRAMRVGVTERVEVRIAKASVEALIESLDGGRAAWRHDVIVSKAMSVRLMAPDGGFFIETASPETQWIENQLGFASDDFASWRFLVTPQARGWVSLQIIVSARTIGADGVAAETALPNQVIDVKVRSNVRRSFSRLAGWTIAALVGGGLAKFGEAGFDVATTIIARFAN